MPRERTRSPRRHRSRSRSRRRSRSRQRSRSPRRRSPRRDLSGSRHSPRRGDSSRHKSPISRRRSSSPRRRRESSPDKSRRSRSPRRRSRSSGDRRESTQTSSSRNPRERPEIREAESSTQGIHRDRNERRSPPRHKSRSRSPVRRQDDRGHQRRERSSRSRSPDGSGSKKAKSSTEDLVLREDISKHTRKKRMMLCDRFADSDHEAFDPEENITIGIERNIRGNSPAVIRREIKPEAVDIPRRKDEGHKPFHKREEFHTREELVEKRVIKVVDDPSRRDPRSHRSRSRERPSLTDRWDGEGDAARRQVVHRDPNFRNRELEERYGHLDRFEERRDVERRFEGDPHDLRHSLASRRRPDVTERRDDQRPDIRSRLGFRDNREDSDPRRRPDGSELPDFKQRPDKGRVPEWTIDPEQIPKSVRYYEHDNRGDADYWSPRGRGFRGRGFRGRGFRGRGGGYRGGWRDFSRQDSGGRRDYGRQDSGGRRDYGRQDSGGRRDYGRQDSGGRRDFNNRGDRSIFGTSDGEWLHDKFAEIEGDAEGGEREGDNQPSSTTEK